MGDQTSTLPLFQDKISKREIDIRLDTITSELSLVNILNSKNLFISENIIPDSLILSNAFVIKNINDAFEIWNKYPWADSIPKDIFFN